MVSRIKWTRDQTRSKGTSPQPMESSLFVMTSAGMLAHGPPGTIRSFSMRTLSEMREYDSQARVAGRERKGRPNNTCSGYFSRLWLRQLFLGGLQARGRHTGRFHRTQFPAHQSIPAWCAVSLIRCGLRGAVYCFRYRRQQVSPDRRNQLSAKEILFSRGIMTHGEYGKEAWRQ